MTGQQLRNSILQEAIQGRLVPNVLEPGEKTGAELLQQILKERQDKEIEEKGNKAKKLSLSLIEEEPWELPGGWCWCLLKDVCSVIGGYAFPSQDLKDGATGIRVIRISDVTETGLSESRLVRYRGNMSLQQYEIKVGDILMAMTGGTVGKSLLLSYLPEPLLLNQRVAAIRNQYFNIRYLDIVLKSPLTKAIIEQAKNSTNDNISMADINGFMVPFPPLSIQEAIVEKIEELLPLIDEYDKAAVELETLNKILPEKLRKSVLQEAIHGNLVPNDIPEGEATASELLQQILKERQDRENKAKGKKAKKLTLSTIEEEPWDLPDGWCWCKLGDGISLLSGRDLEPDKYNANHNGIPYITGASNFDEGTLLINRWTPKPGSVSKKGDLLITCKGTVGELAFNTVGDIHIARQIMAISAIIIDSKYIQVFLNAKVSDLNAQANGVIPGISREDILLADFPLPPLSIQHRIVEKIEEVFSAINNL